MKSIFIGCLLTLTVGMGLFVPSKSVFADSLQTSELQERINYLIQQLQMIQSLLNEIKGKIEIEAEISNSQDQEEQEEREEEVVTEENIIRSTCLFVGTQQNFNYTTTGGEVFEVRLLNGAVATCFEGEIYANRFLGSSSSSYCEDMPGVKIESGVYAMVTAPYVIDIEDIYIPGGSSYFMCNNGVIQYLPWYLLNEGGGD